MAFEVVLLDGSREPLEATDLVSAIGEMAIRHGLPKGRSVTAVHCDEVGVWGVRETGIGKGDGRGGSALRWPRRPSKSPPQVE